MLKRTLRTTTQRTTRAFYGTAAAGGGYDTDAQTYITAVETADGQSLETGVKDAINAFVVGCKSDGIWDAIKAACIMAGARTLDGALVPLVGTAPTNNNFVSGDYNRETGLVGDGATKYLDANRNQDDDPQNDHHMSAFLSTQITGIVLGSSQVSDSVPNDTLAIGGVAGSYRFRSRHDGSSLQTPLDFGDNTNLGFIGIARTVLAGFTARESGANTVTVVSSATTQSIDYFVFRRPRASNPVYSSSRLSFYSIGEALDLALLDSRVSTLMTAIGAAIP